MGWGMGIYIIFLQLFSKKYENENLKSMKLGTIILCCGYESLGGNESPVTKTLRKGSGSGH